MIKITNNFCKDKRANDICKKHINETIYRLLCWVESNYIHNENGSICDDEYFEDYLDKFFPVCYDGTDKEKLFYILKNIIEDEQEHELDIIFQNVLIKICMIYPSNKISPYSLKKQKSGLNIQYIKDTYNRNYVIEQLKKEYQDIKQVTKKMELIENIYLYEISCLDNFAYRLLDFNKEEDISEETAKEYDIHTRTILEQYKEFMKLKEKYYV